MSCLCSVGIYLTVTMAITTLSMVLTVFILNLHSMSEVPVPRWLNIIVLQYLSRILCIRVRCKPRTKRTHTEHPDIRRGSLRMRTLSHNSHNRTMETNIDTVAPILRSNGRPGATNSYQAISNDSVHTNSGVTRVLEDHEEVDLDGEVVSEADKRVYTRQWEDVAGVLDRLFFWLFLFAFIGISILLFHPLFVNYESEKVHA